MNTQNRKLQTTALDVNSEAFVAAPQTTDQRETCSRTAASKNTSGASNSQDLELRSIRCFARGWAAMYFSSMYFPRTLSHISPHEIKLWICENHGTANVSVNASCNCKCQMYISIVTAKLFDKKPPPIPIRVAHYKSNGADADARASTYVPTTTNAMTMTMITRPLRHLYSKLWPALKAKVHAPWPIPCLANFLASCLKCFLGVPCANIVPLRMNLECSCCGKWWRVSLTCFD